MTKSWRLRFFHWLVKGRIKIEEEEKTMATGYGAIAATPYNTINLTRDDMTLPGITFKITEANGGTIVSVKRDVASQGLGGLTLSDQNPELYIIPENAEDFDRELGKIITMHRMKS
jgi:hypothetical protein